MLVRACVFCFNVFVDIACDILCDVVRFVCCLFAFCFVCGRVL